jgi:spermidine/putrescine transport system permease protein
VDHRRPAFWALVLPPVLWLAAFFLLPLFLMALYSFRQRTGGPLFGEPFTLHQYLTFVSVPAYARLLGRSALLAAAIALGSTILAFPIAYYLAFRPGRRPGLRLTLLLIPFWTSYLLRVMAWKFILGSAGLLNAILLSLGILRAPLEALLYNRTAVAITLVYVWTPFAALPILAALQRIQPALLEAAADLGASPIRRFARVVLPLSLPGTLGAFFMVFIPTVGEYVTPLLVGGSRGLLYGNIIQDFFTDAANWPLGAALSMVMLVTTLTLIGLALRLVDLRRLTE